jgi:hypothetical protein
MNTIAQLGRLAAQEVKAAEDDDRWPKSKGSLDDIVGHADDSPNGPNDDSDDSGDAGDDSGGDIGD